MATVEMDSGPTLARGHAEGVRCAALVRRATIEFREQRNASQMRVACVPEGESHGRNRLISAVPWTRIDRCRTYARRT